MQEAIPGRSKLKVVESYSFTPATHAPFVSTYVEWRSFASDAALEYAEALAIALLASVAGPRVRIPILQESKPLACNLFLMILGQSSSSRKSSSQNNAISILEEVRPECILENPGSPEGFIQDLMDHEDIGSTLFIDEMAGFYQSITQRPYLVALKDYILRSYDGTRIGRRLRTKKVQGVAFEEGDIALNPFLTLVANGTPERMANVSRQGDIEDGWWPRWAIVWPDTKPHSRPMSAISEQASQLRNRVVNELRLISDRVHGGGIQAIIQDDCWPLIEEITSRTEKVETDYQPFYERADKRVIKVAALLALSENSRGSGDILIYAHHIRDADTLVSRWITHAMKFGAMLGLNQFEHYCWRAMEKLKREGGECDRRRIAQLLKVPYRTLDDIARTLKDRGLIRTDHEGRIWTVLEP